MGFMLVENWLVISLGLFFSAVLQSFAGFGFSLLLVPLLLLAGLDIVTTVTIGICGSMMQRCLAVRHLREYIDWKQLLSILPVGLVGLATGLFILHIFTELDQKLIRQIIGLIILLLVCIRWILRVEPVEKVRKIWDYVAGFFCGLLGGLANIGGPPLVLWILAHKWHQKKMRVISPAYSLMFVPFQIIIMTIMFGKGVLLTFGNTLLFFPLIFLASTIGMNLGHKCSVKVIRIIMYCILLTISLFTIIKPFF
jgi:hypothetical protein